MSKESLSIILPTYNERINVCRLIPQIVNIVSRAKLDYEILIVDDSSTDGSAQTVQKVFSDNAAVRLIIRKGDRSLAASIREGIRVSRYEFILIMDANFNHRPEDIPRLMACQDRVDIVTGSRFMRGGGMERAVFRFWEMRLLNFLCRVILGVRLTDLLSRFVLVRRQNLLSLDLDGIFVGGREYVIRLFYAIKKKKWNVLEIPINFSKRIGQPKKDFLARFWKYPLVAFKVRFGP